MSYVEQSLGANERIIARAHFHWSYTFVAVMALIFLGILLIGIWIFFAMMVPKWTTEIAVTNHRFIKKTGLFSLHTEEIAIPNIEGVAVSQSFWGRILGFGRIQIEGTGVDKVVTPLIAHPVQFRKAIETAKENVTK
jgi:uncharacterized membrane protein YdbT with pleckstrin-like domain